MKAKKQSVLLAMLVLGVGFTAKGVAAPGASSPAIVVAVAPQGSDQAAGTPVHPYRTLERAQQAVRHWNCSRDVIVELADGVYRLTQPLSFTARDGGCNGFRVVWEAEPGAQPVLSGAVRVSTWKLYDKQRNIYVAMVPVGLDTRQLWVNKTLARKGSVEIPRSDVTFSRIGITLKGHTYDYLSQLPEANRLEIDATGFFTDRIAPVAKVEGHTLVMAQPAWDNNLWGYDTIERPFHPELAHLFLENSLHFLSGADEWYIDPEQGRLYLRTRDSVDPESLDVELPRLSVLLSIGNSLEAPVHDLTFKGLGFSYTTWLGPSGDQGYASQQSGSYLSGHAALYPADPIASCSQGCPPFESVRNAWSQMPASVQVSAAYSIVFDSDVFEHLGQYALGIGNDADATLSGTGLGAGDITVKRSVFADLAGGAILAGGVRPDAHHPHDPREINRDIVIEDNRIEGVSEDYLDNSAVLSTYVEGAVILHNDISHVPYDAIDIGYGWGIEDPGGNPRYRYRMHGYDYPQNPVYTTPTTHRDVVVASNRIHDAKRVFHDGGAIYNLSAGPGTLITENYIYENHGRIGLYLDEGSRYITVRRNVVEDKDGEWLNINTVKAAYPLRVSADNTAIDNWHDSSRTGGMWTNYENDLILNDHFIPDDKWPKVARQVIKSAGIEPSTDPETSREAGSKAIAEQRAATGEPTVAPDSLKRTP